MVLPLYGKYIKQAGAELCQAQVKLWLATIEIKLPKNKFTFHLPKQLKIKVIFHLQKSLGCFPVSSRFEVIFNLPKC